jgi:hypothetical protein
MTVSRSRQSRNPWSGAGNLPDIGSPRPVSRCQHRPTFLTHSPLTARHCLTHKTVSPQHLADVAGQVGDGPAGTARHRRAGVGRHNRPRAGEVGRKAVEDREYSMPNSSAHALGSFSPSGGGPAWHQSPSVCGRRRTCSGSRPANRSRAASAAPAAGYKARPTSHFSRKSRSAAGGWLVGPSSNQ